MSSQEEAIRPGQIDDITANLVRNTHITFPNITQAQYAWQDVVDGLRQWRIWLMLAYQDIKLRYRRSVLGPFWLTISMAITVYSMGYLYAHLFHIELEHYYPFLVAGMLGWTLISTMVNEFAEGITASDRFIKQIKLPFTVHIHKIAARNLIIFFHNLLVLIPILIIFHHSAHINFYTLLLIPGLALVYLNAISYGLLLGMLGARYRDIAQIIKSLVQVVFFVTPVMWSPEVLKGRNIYVAEFNPFYAFLELIRQPLIGAQPTLNNVIVALATTIIGLVISARLFIRYRNRIVYWL